LEQHAQLQGKGPARYHLKIPALDSFTTLKEVFRRDAHSDSGQWSFLGGKLGGARQRVRANEEPRL